MPMGLPKLKVQLPYSMERCHKLLIKGIPVSNEFDLFFFSSNSFAFLMGQKGKWQRKSSLNIDLIS
jgi:hypothetical protein